MRKPHRFRLRRRRGCENWMPSVPKAVCCLSVDAMRQGVLPPAQVLIARRALSEEDVGVRAFANQNILGFAHLAVAVLDLNAVASGL